MENSGGENSGGHNTYFSQVTISKTFKRPIWFSDWAFIIPQYALFFKGKSCLCVTCDKKRLSRKRLTLFLLVHRDRIELPTRRSSGDRSEFRGQVGVPLSITSYLVFRAVFPPSPNPHHRHILLGKSRRSRGRSLYF